MTSIHDPSWRIFVRQDCISRTCMQRHETHASISWCANLFALCPQHCSCPKVNDGSVKYHGCCDGRKCCCGISERSPSHCPSTDSVFERYNHSSFYLAFIFYGSEECEYFTLSLPCFRLSPYYQHLLLTSRWLSHNRCTQGAAPHAVSLAADGSFLDHEVAHDLTAAAQRPKRSSGVEATCWSGRGCAATTTLCAYGNLNHM